MKKLIIKTGREKSLLRRHPWIFSGAIKRDEGAIPGEVVRVIAEDGRYLATALLSGTSQIAARVVSFDEKQSVDETFWRARLTRAIQQRDALGAGSCTDNSSTNAWRLIHGESDGIPGLVADRYGDSVVMQLSTAGIDPHRDLFAALLKDVTGASCVYERSDVDVRKLEGLEVRNGLLLGTMPTNPVLIIENGMRIEVDIVTGHKTGFYLDQRDNRDLTRRLARDREVLNCFCYSGTMSVAAMLGGARSVMSIDSSAHALDTARKNAEHNRCNAAQMEWVEADVFTHLRRLRDQGKSFDLVILDPPKLAPTSHHVEKAARAYKDINLLGLKLLRPGGLLMTYSCSGGVSTELFQKIVAGAAVDAGVEAQILQRLAAGTDHPVSIHFPEGEYLKGLLLRRQ